MTDDHAHDCGHNHDPNPFADAEQSEQYKRLVREMFRVTTVTVALDQRLTTTFAACGLIGATESPRMPAIQAIAWELGSLINIMTGGQEPDLMFGHGDDTEDHVGDPEAAQFGMNAMTAFFTAASVGDLPAAVRVLDAVSAEAVQAHLDPDALLAQFFGNVLVSLSYTARVHLADPMHIFRD